MKKIVVISLLWLVLAMAVVGCSGKNTLVGVWVNTAEPSVTINIDADNVVTVVDVDGETAKGEVLENERLVLNAGDEEAYFEYHLDGDKLVFKDDFYGLVEFKKVEGKRNLNIGDNLGMWRSKNYILNLTKNGFVIFYNAHHYIEWGDDINSYNEFSIPVEGAVNDHDGLTMAMEKVLFEEVDYINFFEYAPGILSVVYRQGLYNIPFFYDDAKEQLYFHGIYFNKLSEPTVVSDLDFYEPYIEYYDERKGYSDWKINSESIESIVSDTFNSQGLAFYPYSLTNYPSWVNQDVFSKFYAPNDYLFSLIGYFVENITEEPTAYRILFSYDFESKTIRFLDSTDDMSVVEDEYSCYQTLFNEDKSRNNLMHYNHKGIQTLLELTKNGMEDEFGTEYFESQSGNLMTYNYSPDAPVWTTGKPYFRFRLDESGSLSASTKVADICFTEGVVLDCEIGKTTLKEVEKNLGNPTRVNTGESGFYVMNYETEDLYYAFAFDSKDKEAILGSVVVLRAIDYYEMVGDSQSTRSDNATDTFPIICNTLYRVSADYTDGVGNPMDSKYKPYIAFFEDGTFNFFVNMYTDVGYIKGHYTYTDNYIECSASEHSIEGVLGADIGGFSFEVKNGSTLIYKGDEIGVTKLNDQFNYSNYIFDADIQNTVIRQYAEYFSDNLGL